MVSTNPQSIRGNWTSGYALDFHTVPSECIGPNEFGYLQFRNVRSELGDLIYTLKYNRDLSAAQPIASAAANFLSEWNPNVDLIVPVPPSALRDWQPVNVLAREIAKYSEIDYDNECIFKTKSTPELKNVGDFDQRSELLGGAYSVYKGGVQGRKILVVDDLFRSGATLTEICKVLRKNGRVEELYVLAITRTRNRT